MKKKQLRKTSVITLAVAMVLSLSNGVAVNAAESDNAVLPSTNAATVEADSLVSDIPSIEEYKLDSFDELSLDENAIALLAGEGDQYESNNSPATATTGRYNKITYASLHEENDTDWYKIEIYDTSNPISIILTNIPSKCDYDVFFVDYNPTDGILGAYGNFEDGNTPEQMILTVNQTGTYYVVVQRNPEVPNNYSDSNYKLYIGDYFREGVYSADTGASADFGYIKAGNTAPVYTDWYSYNLTNSSQIPDNAIVDSFYLTSDGNGNSWIGFYKTLATGNGTIIATKSGGIDLMYYYTGNNTAYLAKQNWRFRGYVSSSTYFTWEPRVRIDYIFGVTIDTLSFVK